VTVLSNNVNVLGHSRMRVEVKNVDQDG